LEGSDLLQRRAEGLGREAGRGGEGVGVARPSGRRRSPRHFEILELPADPRDALVEDRPGHAFGLAEDGGGGLGVAVGFVVEAFAPQVRLEAALGDRRPGDEDARGVGDGAVALVAGEVARPAPSASPQRIASPVFPGWPK
jgi:hypothetical protein